MYTDCKVYQIIIALLKEYGIRNCVLSAGSRNVPFVHSVEEDSYFKCYSVVDERSAGYFAMGLAQELNEPVVISCTSSTATCNYWPAVAEAFYQNVPIIVLTSDRNPSGLGQLEDQMIDQVGMYDRHVRKSVNLPLDVERKDDINYCQRLVNEALLELNHHGKGPVHINIPMRDYNGSFNTRTLPAVRKINRVELTDRKETWLNYIDKLKRAKRIMVICGQNSNVPDELKDLLEIFFTRYNSVIAAEYMGNVEGKSVINMSLCFESRIVNAQTFQNFLPDIVITFGGTFVMGVKALLKQNSGQFEHWLIKEDGSVTDPFMSLTTIFECNPQFFFKYCLDNADSEQKNDLQYYNSITKQVIKYEQEFAYSNVYVIKEMVEKIPDNSNLHLSINSAIRITNYFKLQSGIKVYANIGTHGIDGCLSSFLGQACGSPDKLNYLIIGDLAFFYDMNSLRIRHINNNVRILFINNHGGEEFYYNGMWQNENSDLHTAARHNTVGEGWIKSLGFTYLTANDKHSYKEALEKFMAAKSDKPIILEVFTEMKSDSEEIYRFYGIHAPTDKTVMGQTKKAVKRIMGPERTAKIKKMLRKA